jgi:hypothetical protein
MAGSIPPPNIPLVDEKGYIQIEWYRWLAGKEVGIEAGAVAAGTGLTGGGPVSTGVEISVADHGIGNTQLRNGSACSVIGRQANSTGSVADITADANNRVLTREDDEVAFRDHIEGVSVGATVPATGRFTTLRVDQAPTAAVLAALGDGQLQRDRLQGDPALLVAGRVRHRLEVDQTLRG